MISVPNRSPTNIAKKADKKSGETAQSKDLKKIIKKRLERAKAREFGKSQFFDVVI
jgi:hypothetical protein